MIKSWLTKVLQRRVLQARHKRLVVIAGPSCSGKSWLIQKIQSGESSRFLARVKGQCKFNSRVLSNKLRLISLRKDHAKGGIAHRLKRGGYLHFDVTGSHQRQKRKVLMDLMRCSDQIIVLNVVLSFDQWITVNAQRVARDQERSVSVFVEGMLRLYSRDPLAARQCYSLMVDRWHQYLETSPLSRCITVDSRAERFVDGADRDRLGLVQLPPLQLIWLKIRYMRLLSTVGCWNFRWDEMNSDGFKGIYLQSTGDPHCFSFVTYTPQSREQMIACGDLDEHEEYFNPVVFDFLLFVSEVVLDQPPGLACPIGYDDITVRWSRQRGSGIQHEYLIQFSQHDWDDAKQSILHQLQAVLSSPYWNGSRMSEPTWLILAAPRAADIPWRLLSPMVWKFWNQRSITSLSSGLQWLRAVCSVECMTDFCSSNLDLDLRRPPLNVSPAGVQNASPGGFLIRDPATEWRCAF